VFEHIGDALAILITLDHIFMNSPMLKEHWNQYKRSARGHPGREGVVRPGLVGAIVHWLGLMAIH